MGISRPSNIALAISTIVVVLGGCSSSSTPPSTSTPSTTSTTSAGGESSTASSPPASVHITNDQWLHACTLLSPILTADVPGGRVDLKNPDPQHGMPNAVCKTTAAGSYVSLGVSSAAPQVFTPLPSSVDGYVAQLAQKENLKASDVKCEAVAVDGFDAAYACENANPGGPVTAPFVTTAAAAGPYALRCYVSANSQDAPLAPVEALAKTVCAHALSAFAG